MGKSLERFREIVRNQPSDNSPNSPQKVSDEGGTELSGAIVPIVRGSLMDDEAEERAAVVEYDSGIPRAWAVAYALLLTTPQPAWLSKEQWQAHHDAAGKLLACWSAQMERLGWHPTEVLGVDAKWPGKSWAPCLLSALVGVTVGAVAADRISITFPDGGSRCLERRKGQWVYA